MSPSAPPPAPSPAPPPGPAAIANAPKRQLNLFDSACIIVGIVIGAGIYETSPLVAASVGSPAALLLIWCFGGIVALMGALCYAELATTYSQDGGDYIYLTRAFGVRFGFLFAWAEYWIIRPGNVGMMAFVFARFARDLLPLQLSAGTSRFDDLAYACGAIILLTVLNLLGVRAGKLTQNLLTTIKVGGLLAIFLVGVFLVPQAADRAADPGVATDSLPTASPATNYQLALILVLFAYGGWNEMSYVAAEVRDPNRNIYRALLLGTLTITLVYVAVNLAFVRALGMQGMGESRAVAADVLRLQYGPRGGQMMSTLVCLSCLGAINGLLFTGSRVFYAAGADHRLIAWLGRWHAGLDTPLRALLVQLAATLALVIGFGWYEQGFDRLLHFSTPVFWFFAATVGLSFFVLRRKDPHLERPHRVIFYPWTPLLFCASSLFLCYASCRYAWANFSVEAQWTIAIFAAGIAVSLFSGSRRGN